MHIHKAKHAIVNMCHLVNHLYMWKVYLIGLLSGT